MTESSYHGAASNKLARLIAHESVRNVLAAIVAQATHRVRVVTNTDCASVLAFGITLVPTHTNPTMADKPFIARGFHGKRQSAQANRLPPGQYETHDFPVLSAGPTPQTNLGEWDFRIDGRDGRSVRWSWEELRALPHETPTVDIHCVTKWSKFDTKWEGVSVDVLLNAARDSGVADQPFVIAFSDGGYTTNLPRDDVTGGKAWVVFGYDGEPLPAEHGGPARLLVPHLYFWKSAKWVRGLRTMECDDPGFWEQLGYHDRGDPWREQRYQGDQ